MLVVAVVLAVACSKTEDPIVPESKLVGAWKAPTVANGGMMEDFRGKNLIINKNHTASFSVIYFNNWKLEGDVLTLTNYYTQGTNRHAEVLRYTIMNYSDSAMYLSGYYINVVGDSVVQEDDMSGIFTRDTTYTVPQ